MGTQVLQVLGFSSERAEQAYKIFQTHNLKVLKEVYPHYRDQDQEKVISLNLKARRELEEMFAGDAAAFDASGRTEEDARQPS
jgi:glutathione-regulated potassium-efflux system ancillary protein KefC